MEDIVIAISAAMLGIVLTFALDRIDRSIKANTAALASCSAKK